MVTDLERTSLAHVYAEMEKQWQSETPDPLTDP